MDYDITPIQESLEVMDSRRRLGFGICLLERAIPMFYQFQVETGHPGTAELLAALATCWATIESDQPGHTTFIHPDDCEKVMPDSEDYGSFYTPAALDALQIGCSLLEFIHTKSLKSIIEAVQAQLDTIDLAIQALVAEYHVDENDEMVSGNKSLMSLEMARMLADIAFLKEQDDKFGNFASRLSQHILLAGYQHVKIIAQPR